MSTVRAAVPGVTDTCAMSSMTLMKKATAATPLSGASALLERTVGTTIGTAVRVRFDAGTESFHVAISPGAVDVPLPGWSYPITDAPGATAILVTNGRFVLAYVGVSTDDEGFRHDEEFVTACFDASGHLLRMRSTGPIGRYAADRRLRRVIGRYAATA